MATPAVHIFATRKLVTLIVMNATLTKQRVIGMSGSHLSQYAADDVDYNIRPLDGKNTIDVESPAH